MIYYKNASSLCTTDKTRTSVPKNNNYASIHYLITKNNNESTTDASGLVYEHKMTKYCLFCMFLMEFNVSSLILKDKGCKSYKSCLCQK